MTPGSRERKSWYPPHGAKGRADPRVANELDEFMAAASERLGEEGMCLAPPAAAEV
jgi:hypothetical protein